MNSINFFIEIFKIYRKIYKERKKGVSKHMVYHTMTVLQQCRSVVIVTVNSFVRNSSHVVLKFDYGMISQLRSRIPLKKVSTTVFLISIFYISKVHIGY